MCATIEFMIFVLWTPHSVYRVQSRDIRDIQNGNVKILCKDHCKRGALSQDDRLSEKNRWNILLFLIILIGVCLILYPTVADWWNSFHQSRAVASYTEAINNMDREEYDRILQSALAYNDKLAKTGALWTMDEEQKKEYLAELDATGTGILGYIDIPKINVTLPIYHGTEEKVLQVAIGHIEGTSLPVGGTTSHCVVSGHRGLPSAKLFTDLDKMAEGDTWTMTIMDYTVTYEVDQIRVVEPSDLSDLQIVKGKDYCTLVTCTPYGINSHRLLVRGHRISNLQGDARVTADAIQLEPIFITPFFAVPILLLLIILLIGYNHEEKQHKRIWKQARKEYIRVLRKGSNGYHRRVQSVSIEDIDHALEQERNRKKRK